MNRKRSLRKPRKPSRSRRKPRKPSRSRRKPSRSRRKPSRSRRKPRKPSRSRRKPRKPSRSLRKPRKPSRSRRKGVVRHSFGGCPKSAELYTEKQIYSLAKKILSLQDRREEYLKKQLVGSTLKFAYGMKSKTKYVEKSLKNAYDYSKRWVSLLSQTDKTPVFLIDKLYAVLTQHIVSHQNLTKLMSVVDLGYRIGYPKLHVITVLLNMILFGFLLGQNWEMFLVTPIGISMLSGAMEGNKKEQEAVVKMLIHVSCNGVDPSDILSFVPQHTDFCNTSTTLKWLLNKGLRRAIYEIGTRGGCAKHVVTEWNNIIKSVLV